LHVVVPLPQQEVRVLGRYALYDEIAAGGMATVHIGRLLGPVGFSRTVAIKRLHAQYAKDPEFVSMFLDEARLAARIRHPNVIGTLDVVALSGELFLVMEYVPGDSFAKLWRSAREAGKPIPLSIVSAILVGLLEGLHAAHEATNDRGEPLGIVHRDVSPHNVIVGTDGIARVLDFGVAKAAGRLQTTREGQLKGKISYMAPEQVQGTVDRTTDIYAASVVLWEALTGKRLFFAENEARTLANVLYPRVEQPSRHARGIPGKLDAVVLRGLDPNPAGRFQTAREMARALQTAMPPAASYEVGDWVQATAGATVVMRAQRVATIERATTTDSDFRPMQVPRTPVRVSELGLRAPIANDAGPGSDLATVTAPSKPPSYDSPRRRGWLGIAVALVLVAGFAALATRAISLPGVSGGAVAGAPAAIPIATSHATATATVLTPPAPPPPVAAAPSDTAAALPFPAAPTTSAHPAASTTVPFVPFAAKPAPHPVGAAPKRTDVEFEHVLDSRK
jgi:serine/threonine protein kinase